VNGWLLLLELDGTDSDAVLRKTTWGLDVAGQNGQLNSLESAGGIGGLLAVHDADLAEDYVYLYDANGNVGQLVAWVDGYEGATGSQWHADRMVATYEYTPYGALRASAGDYADDNPFRFSTKQWDDETGLGYWGYRYYSPTLGRWISRDPEQEMAGYNLYAYVLNQVMSSVDGLGLAGYFLPGIRLMHPDPAGPPRRIAIAPWDRPSSIAGRLAATSGPELDIDFDPLAMAKTLVGDLGAAEAGFYGCRDVEFPLGIMGPGVVKLAIEVCIGVSSCCCEGQRNLQFEGTIEGEVKWVAGVPGIPEAHRRGRLTNGNRKLGRNARVKEGYWGKDCKLKNARITNNPTKKYKGGIGVSGGSSKSVNGCNCKGGVEGSAWIRAQAKAGAIFTASASAKCSWDFPGGGRKCETNWHAGLTSAIGASAEVAFGAKLTANWYVSK